MPWQLDSDGFRLHDHRVCATFGPLRLDTVIAASALVQQSERNGDVLPLLLRRTLRELAFDTDDYLGELTVVERPYEDEAGVWPLGFGPLARKRREVAAVTSDEDALLGGSQFEHLWVR